MHNQKVCRTKKPINWTERRNTLTVVAGRRALDPVEQAHRLDCARRVHAVIALLPHRLATVLKKCDLAGLPLRTLGKPTKVCRQRKEARKVFGKLWKQCLSA